MVICKEIGQLSQRYQFNKDFSAKIVSGQMFIYQMIISTKQNAGKTVLEPRKHDKCNH